ncbi:MAG: Ig-like domain-containing protein [Candidatus Omnitrophica bacterium]|nr:Ig-like domain-containing protein [Candidatus Omnitrophota bacterium]
MAIALYLGKAGSLHADTYTENFDGWADGTYIPGSDRWELEEGEAADAVVEDETTFSGQGNALKLVGDEDPLKVYRPDSYSSATPTWVEFTVKPGIGSERKNIPENKLIAVTFDYSGRIYAADGTDWADTGYTFDSDQWYHVTVRLNFENKSYNLYVSPYTGADQDLNIIAQNLQFIDPSLAALSKIAFENAYSTRRTDDSYIDELLVHAINQIMIITPPQVITKDKPSGAITIQLQNSYGELQSAPRDITIMLSSTSATGDFSLQKDAWISITQGTIAEGEQQITVYYKDSKEGQYNLRADEDPDKGWLEATQPIEVTSDSTPFEVILNTPQIAGQYFDVTIIAKDEDGNIQEDYDGDIEITPEYLSPSSGTQDFVIQPFSGFKNGVATVSMMYSDAGTIKVNVKDTADGSKSGSSGSITFVPASFNVTVDTTAQQVGESFEVTVQALNALGEVTPNYNGTINITPIIVSGILDGGTITPSSYTFTNGEATIDIAYNRWGSIKIQAADSAYPAQKGVSSKTINFSAAELAVDIKFPSNRDFFYTGETFDITVSVLDGNGNPIPNYQGVIQFSSLTSINLPSEYIFTDADNGKKIFSATAQTPGTNQIWVEEKSTGLKKQSPIFEIVLGTLIVIAPPDAPIGSVEITVGLVDENGNYIQENNLEVLLQLDEENPDGSAYSSSLLTPIKLQNGKAIMTLSNSEAENVLLTPYSSDFQFKVQEGQVRFGRIAKSGIGTSLWREIKKIFE